MKTKSKSKHSIDYHTNQYVRQLNDLYVGTKIVLDALALKLAEIESSGKDKYHFVVPSGGKRETARINRDLPTMVAMLENMMAKDERSKSLLVAVSITEDFLMNMLKLVLRAYPDRITRGTKGGEAAMAVPLIEVIEKGRDEILEEKIQSRLSSALYASPAEYLKYIRGTLAIVLSEERMNIFIEIKATRDIVIHANGRANEKYVEKAGTLRRGEAGDMLSVDQEYFDRSIANMKGLMLEIGSGLQTKYDADPQVKACVKHFLS